MPEGFLYGALHQIFPENVLNNVINNVDASSEVSPEQLVVGFHCLLTANHIDRQSQ